MDSKFKSKITDFGISKSLKHGQTNKTKLDGQSERYLGYEYLVEQKSIFFYLVSTKADIWSLGCLIYEIITEKLAWNGLNGPQCVVKVS